MKYGAIRLLLTFMILLVLLPGQVNAKASLNFGGEGNPLLTAPLNVTAGTTAKPISTGTCETGGSCHTTASAGSVTLGFSLANVDQGAAVNVTTETTGIGSPDNILSMTLLNDTSDADNNLGFHPTNEGWVIDVDSLYQANSPGHNFNSRMSLADLDDKWNWTLLAPTTSSGTHYLKVQIRHGGSSSLIFTSAATSINVNSGVPEFPLGAIPLFMTLGGVYFIMIKRRI